MQNLYKSLLLFVIMGLTNVSNGQNSIHINVSNTSGCTWTVTYYDGTMAFLGSDVVSGTSFTSYCIKNFSFPVEYISVDDGTCVLTFGSGSGNFPYTLYSSPCGGTTCSSGIDCSGGVPSICSGPQDPYIIIRIN